MCYVTRPYFRHSACKPMAIVDDLNTLPKLIPFRRVIATTGWPWRSYWCLGVIKRGKGHLLVPANLGFKLLEKNSIFLSVTITIAKVDIRKEIFQLRAFQHVR